MRCSSQDHDGIVAKIPVNGGNAHRIPVNGGSRPWVKAVEFVPYQVVEAAKHNHKRLERNSNVQEPVLEERPRLSGQDGGVQSRMP